jgi:hypothetical protein
MFSIVALTLVTNAPLRGASRSQAEYGVAQMASAPPGTLPGALNAPGVRLAICTCMYGTHYHVPACLLGESSDPQGVSCWMVILHIK